MTHYSDVLLKYFHHTDHQGILDEALSDVVSAKAQSANQEEVFHLFLQIKKDVIVKARFLATGSVAIIAGGEYLCVSIEAKKITELNNMTVETIQQDLRLSPLKIHTVQLLLSVLKQCMILID